MDIFDIFKNNDTDIKCDCSLTGDFNDYIPVTTSFNECLKIEKIGQPVADDFYKKCLDAINIRRYDYHVPDQKTFQINDIDCSIELEVKSLDIFWLNVSEKFRQYDAGDMCLELWSNLEKQSPGWATKKDGPDIYLYVTPKYFFTISHDQWFYEMINRITKEWTLEKINDFLKKEKASDIDSGSFPIKTCGYDATLIKSVTKSGLNTWHGICVCIPWKTLVNEFFLYINVYDRDYKRININKIYE